MKPHHRGQGSLGTCQALCSRNSDTFYRTLPLSPPCPRLRAPSQPHFTRECRPSCRTALRPPTSELGRWGRRASSPAPPLACPQGAGAASQPGRTSQLPGHNGHQGRDMLLFLILFFYKKKKKKCQSTDPRRNPAGRAQPAAPPGPRPSGGHEGSTPPPKGRLTLECTPTVRLPTGLRPRLCCCCA